MKFKFLMVLALLGGCKNSLDSSKRSADGSISSNDQELLSRGGGSCAWAAQAAMDKLVELLAGQTYGNALEGCYAPAPFLVVAGKCVNNLNNALTGDMPCTIRSIGISTSVAGASPNTGTAYLAKRRDIGIDPIVGGGGPVTVGSGTNDTGSTGDDSSVNPCSLIKCSSGKPPIRSPDGKSCSCGKGGGDNGLNGDGNDGFIPGQK